VVFELFELFYFISLSHKIAKFATLLNKFLIMSDKQKKTQLNTDKKGIAFRL
jgi:hypothetical protein